MAENKTDKIKIEVEIDQTLMADYQFMLDEINHNCKKQHDQQTDACIPLTFNSCTESNMKSQLMQYEIGKAIRKYQ